ncbi:hypothetical protein GCM10009037_04610 [Halarchaeum grantii]|uniref:Uncharacterized protein n=1 Tax=Halarchaeum grantii TaxID=1193105 RepID=A0A830F6K3_9EURY|nr:hypothetical protein [Halarchaeum grantii]GGL24171.1 hypothetical protein GCM10009037_04610 [Halarchaeum grantii]
MLKRRPVFAGERVHETAIGRGDVAAHDGTERLVADSADEYRWRVFDD